MILNLPKKDKEGIPYLSYSQIDLWNTKRGFDTGLPGNQEYIRKYFLGEKSEGGPFATFGKEVEDYICKRECADKFTEEERSVLETIQPLGNFQTELKLNFEGFYLKCILDDRSDDYSHVLDYKTASESSAKKYHKEDYYQLDIYALAIKQLTGKLPAKMTICAISREGNGFKFGRDVLKVGKDVWYIDRETNTDRLKILQDNIISTALEISEYYTVFEKLNKIK